MGALLRLVPGIRLFRAPDMVMFLFVFGAATLAALGVDRLLQLALTDDTAGWKRMEKVLGSVAGFMAVLALLAASGVLTNLWTSVIYPDIDPNKAAALQALQPFLTRGAFVAAILVSSVAGMAWLVRRAFLAPVALVAGLVVLVAVDQLRVDGSFIQTLDFQDFARPDPGIQALLEQEEGRDEPYRLLSFMQVGQDVSPAMHGIELAAGHHPNDLGRYRELIGMVASGEPANLYNGNIRQILNVRYILWPDIDPRYGPGPDGNIITRVGLQDGRVYQTLYADAGLPRARLVGSATVKSDTEAVPYMLSDAFNPEREVVLPEAPPTPLPGGPVAGAVRWEERTPNRLRLSVTSDRPALLVVADNWFPAWQATVDGADAPVLRAYHTLRAVPVPAGSSTVEMTYHSGLLAGSFWLSLITLSMLLVLGGWGVLRDRRRVA